MCCNILPIETLTGKFFPLSKSPQIFVQLETTDKPKLNSSRYINFAEHPCFHKVYEIKGHSHKGHFCSHLLCCSLIWMRSGSETNDNASVINPGQWTKIPNPQNAHDVSLLTTHQLIHSRERILKMHTFLQRHARKKRDVHPTNAWFKHYPEVSEKTISQSSYSGLMWSISI